MFNPAVARLGEPPVAIVLDWLASYDGSKGALIDMSQAVPGYPGHPSIAEALKEAASGPVGSGYGPIRGEDALRDAYADHLSDIYGACVAREHVHITSGCNQAFVACALVMAGHGDEVLMTRPCYFNHESALEMIGVAPVYVECRAEAGMLPDIADIEAAVTQRTRALALVSPNNPCGVHYPAGLLDSIFDLCRSRGMRLLVDETYRDFMPAGTDRPHGLLARDDWHDTLVQIYSFSKSYCMPGHRVGAVAAGECFIRELSKVMDNIQICAPRAPQIALARLIPELGGWREENRLRIAGRAEKFRQAMCDAPGWQLSGAGAYFGYASHPFADTPSIEVANRMAIEAGVLAIPGTFFGAGQERHIRFAFANAASNVIAELPARLKSL